MPTGKPTRIKKCKICNDDFLPKTPSQLICEKDHYQPCPVCGKPILWNHSYEVPVCSKECKNIRRKQRCVERYGVEHPMQSEIVQQHHKQSMLKRYGVESPLQSEEIKQKVISTNREKFGSDWILGCKDKKEEFQSSMIERYGAKTTLESDILKEKVRQTNIERYGFDNPMKNKDVQQKVKETCIQRYGVDNPMKNKDILNKAIMTRISIYGSIWNKDIKQKAIRTFIKRYGVDNPFKSEEIKEKIKKERTKKYGESWYIPGYKNKVSKINIAFAEYCKSIGINVSYERYIEGKYFDINIDDRNIVVEIDPSYTHSYKENHFHNKVENDYNKSKTILANSHGLRCIHIWDWDDSNKVARMLQPIIHKIYARKCKIFILNQDFAQKFHEDYNIYHREKERMLHLGLVYENELIQVMSFRSYDIDNNYDYELLDVCTKPTYQIIGGASKLFHFATNEYEMDNIVAFCDLSKFQGSVFQKIGMTYVRDILPSKYWSLYDMCIPDDLLNKHIIENELKIEFQENDSIESAMMRSPWLPIYDCGQSVYEYRSR